MTQPDFLALLARTLTALAAFAGVGAVALILVAVHLGSIAADSRQALLRDDDDDEDDDWTGGIVECRVCGNRHAASWRSDDPTIDAIACVRCGADACSPMPPEDGAQLA